MMMMQQRSPSCLSRSTSKAPRTMRQVHCAATTTAVKLQSIPLTPEAFEPFGQVQGSG